MKLAEEQAGVHAPGQACSVVCASSSRTEGVQWYVIRGLVGHPITARAREGRGIERQAAREQSAVHCVEPAGAYGLSPGGILRA